MGRIVKIIITVGLNLFILFNVFSFSSSSTNDTQKDLSVYTDIIQDKTNYTYDIETKHELPNTAFLLTDIEKYIINDQYAYHKLYRALRLEKDEYREQLVIKNTNGNDSYERISRDSARGPAEEYIPFFKKYDDNILASINQFWSNPVFRLEAQIGNQSTMFDVNINDLNADEKAYVESYIKQYFDFFETFDGENLGVFAYFYNSKISYIELDYTALVGGDLTLKQKISISPSVALDTTGLINGAIDLQDIEQNVTTMYPFKTIDETISLSNDYYNTNAEFYFIEIDTAGEYRFTSTSDNLDVLFSWYLYDLEGNQHKPYINKPNPIYFDKYTEYLYLNPGIYYIYLPARPINCNSATITYSSHASVDDYLNSFNTGTEVLTTNGQLTFNTDYAYDVDTFVVSGDYDYIVISCDSTFGLAFGNLKYEDLKYSAGAYIVQKPLIGDLILHFSSMNLGIHTFDLKYYDVTDEPIDFTEAPSIDVYEYNNVQLAVPFYGQKDRFTFSINEHSSALVKVANASFTIWDSNLVMVQNDSAGFYELIEGEYYIEIYGFLNFVSTLTINLEKFDDDQIIMLPPELNTHQIQGYVASREDVDIYQFTLDADKTIQFNCIQAIQVLIYGVDNPYMNIFDARAKFPYFLPEGTFNMTLPANAGLIYNFEFTIGEAVNETEFVDYESIEVIDDLTTYTYLMSFDYFADAEKISIHVDHAAKLSLEFPTGLRVNGVFTNASNGSKYYFAYPSTSPATLISIPGPGELVLTFETLVNYAYQTLIYGDFVIKMNLELVN